jgi:hypothetical protein
LVSGGYRLFRFRGVLYVLFSLLLLPVAIAGELPSEPPEPSQADAHALWLGRNVLAIAEAIRHPEGADAMEAVRTLGHDSRHCVMVRGWLEMQLAADTSILEARQGEVSPLVAARIAFLRKAIRAIDLE